MTGRLSAGSTEVSKEKLKSRCGGHLENGKRTEENWMEGARG